MISFPSQIDPSYGGAADLESIDADQIEMLVNPFGETTTFEWDDAGRTAGRRIRLH